MAPHPGPYTLQFRALLSLLCDIPGTGPLWEVRDTWGQPSWLRVGQEEDRRIQGKLGLMANFLLPHTIPTLAPGHAAACPNSISQIVFPSDCHVLSWDFYSDLPGLWHEITEGLG